MAHIFSESDEFAPEWEPVRPGLILQAELDERHLSQADLAARMGVSKKHLNQVISGMATLSADVALALERTMGPSAQFWLRMEADWRAAQVAKEAEIDLSTQIPWLAHFPAEVIEGLGVVARNAKPVERINAILRHFGVSNPAAFDRVWVEPQQGYQLNAAFKRSSVFRIDPYCTALWLRTAEIEAEEAAIGAPPYSAKLVRAAAAQLPELTRMPPGETFRAMQKLLRKAGVILVFVPEIRDTRLSGVSLWLGSDRPMIALTNRYRFVDALWFSLAHEIAHILLHLKRETFVDGGFTDDEIKNHLFVSEDANGHEAAANDYAQNLLLAGTDPAVLKEIATPADLRVLADRHRVSVTLLAGQYGHQTGNWSKFGKLRERVNLLEAIG